MPDVPLHTDSAIPHLRVGDLAGNWIKGPCGRLKDVPIGAVVAQGAYLGEKLAHHEGDGSETNLNQAQGKLPLASRFGVAIAGVVGPDRVDLSYYPSLQPCPFEWNSPDDSVNIYKPGRLLRLSVALVDRAWVFAASTSVRVLEDHADPVHIFVADHQCPGATWQWSRLTWTGPMGGNASITKTEVLFTGTFTGVTGLSDCNGDLIDLADNQTWCYQQAPPGEGYIPPSLSNLTQQGPLKGPFYFDG